MELRQYAALSAVEMARLVRQGEVSPVELVQSSLNAIEETEARVNAYSAVFAEDAKARAVTLS